MSEQRQPIAVIQNTGVGLKLTDFNDVQRLAAYVFASGLVPKTLDSPEKIGIALLHGMEIGLPPMMSLQRIAVINGMPTVYGDAALAIVEASGKLLFIREFIEGGKLDDPNTYAVCEVHRKGKPEPIRRTYSIGDAQRAGLLAKGGPWRSNPARMLQMRARGFALRDTFADVLGGLYLHEEIVNESIETPRTIKDVTPIEEEDGPPPAPPRATSKPPSNTPSPEFDEELDDGLPPAPKTGTVLVSKKDGTSMELSERYVELIASLDEYSDSEKNLNDWYRIAEAEQDNLNKGEWNQLLKNWTRRMSSL